MSGNAVTVEAPGSGRSGEFTSIGEAVTAGLARANSVRVVVGPGTYREALTLNGQVELVVRRRRAGESGGDVRRRRLHRGDDRVPGHDAGTLGNARDARSSFEQAIERQAARLARLPSPTADQLTELTDVDLGPFTDSES